MNDTSILSNAEQRARFHTLLTHFSNAMLVTHGPDACLRARPMAVARIEADCSVWFITSTNSPKTHEMEANASVLVVCQNDSGTYLSMCGRAETSCDRAKILELWQESFKSWFPAGKSDPTIQLIQVHPEQGEFWDTAGLNKIEFDRD